MVTDRPTDRPTDRLTDRQTDRQTDQPTDRQTDERRLRFVSKNHLQSFRTATNLLQEEQ